MINKLKSTLGESIAESLVSILVVAIASILFAGMVTASYRVIEQSTDWMARYYAAVSAINNQPELKDGENDRVKKQEHVTITIAGDGKTEYVTAYVNEDMGVNIASYIKEDGTTP